MRASVVFISPKELIGVERATTSICQLICGEMKKVLTGEQCAQDYSLWFIFRDPLPMGRNVKTMEIRLSSRGTRIASSERGNEFCVTRQVFELGDVGHFVLPGEMNEVELANLLWNKTLQFIMAITGGRMVGPGSSLSCPCEGPPRSWRIAYDLILR